MELSNYIIQSNEADDPLINPEYSCEYSIDISYGKYVWCGNMSAPNGYGFTLTNSSNTDIYGNPNTFAMQLKFKLSEQLFEECEFYEIYSPNGGLLGYNVGPLQKEFSDFKKISSDIIGTELKIIFSKRKQLTKEQEEIVYKRLMRTPKVPVYTIKIIVPNILQFGELNDCNICLDSVTNDNNKYISSCGHLFHLNCIFEYLEHNNLLHQMHPKCEKLCCGAKKIKQFNCVVCNTTNYK